MRIVAVPGPITLTGSVQTLLTNAQMIAVEGAVSVFVVPTVDMAITDTTTNGNFAGAGAVCPAGIPTEIAHRAGDLVVISNGGGQVKVSIGCVP
jgi:flavoprotein